MEPVSLSIKINEEVKQLIEPFNMAILKPIGKINSSIDEASLKEGSYYYFPHFQDTRIYRIYDGQDHTKNNFELYCEDLEDIQ